ncbi:MAG: hypothetical protein ACOCXA_02125 [Planctomycetota bacterium]
MNAVTAMLIDAPGVLVDGRGVPLPAAEPVLVRMRLAQVPVLVFAEDPLAPEALAPLGNSVDAITALIAPAGFPAVRALLQACRNHAVELASSWMLTARVAALQAAATAGIPQAVWLGPEPPRRPPLLRIETARDLADAPRVMIPAGGGCWHG